MPAMKQRWAAVFRIASGNSVGSGSGNGFRILVIVRATTVGVSLEFIAGRWCGRSIGICRASAAAGLQQPQRR